MNKNHSILFSAAVLAGIFLVSPAGNIRRAEASDSAPDETYEAETFVESANFMAQELSDAAEADTSAGEDAILDEYLSDTDNAAILESAEQVPDTSGSSASASKKSSDSSSSDLDGLIEDPSGNKVDGNLKFEITDEWYKEEIAREEAEAAQSVYGRLYPPAPLLDGINSFRQGDMRWGLHPYGYANAAGTIPATISSSGCGILSLVNAVYYMTGNFIDPAQLADWSASHGFRQNGTGTVHALYRAYAESYGAGLGFEYAGTASSLSQISSFLSEGGTAIISTPHHLMAVADYDPSKGGYLLLDSAPSSYRGTYPTGYRYLSAQDFAESIPIYAIIMLKPIPADKTMPLMIPVNAMAEREEASESLFSYILDSYLHDQPAISSDHILPSDILPKS